MYEWNKCGVQKVYCSVEVYYRKKKTGHIIMFTGLVIINILLLSFIIMGYEISDIKGMKNIKWMTGYDNIDDKGCPETINRFMFSDNKAEEIKMPFYIGLPLPANKTVQSNEEFFKKENSSISNPKQASTDFSKPEKVAYLTFDDGPSKSITPQVLKILEEYNIKASFFVLGEMCRLNPEILKQVQDKGHLICNHTFSHDYKSIYRNEKAFIKELESCENTIVSILGSNWDYNKFIRFPGGSFGKKFDSYKAEIRKLGYVNFDWNALNGDAEGINIPEKKLLANIIKTTENNNKSLILMHDSAGKETTVKALPDIIKYLKEKGYVFETLKTY